MAEEDERTLWTRPSGVRCVLLAYDDVRYQLKLVRATGTIKTDLFAEYDAAIAASRAWRAEIDEPGQPWPPRFDH